MHTVLVKGVLIVSIGYTWQFGADSLNVILIVVATLVLLLNLTSSENSAVDGSHNGSNDAVFAITAQDKEIPTYPHPEGAFEPTTGLVIANVDTPDEFDNSRCRGKYIFLHRPTFDKELEASGEYPYAQHFRKRKRIWEHRFQLVFKETPEGEIYFGCECEEYVYMNSATKFSMKAVVKWLRPIVGDALYHSVGDDPGTHKGECEKPAFMMPLWAFDQVIVTPEGEEPPSLTDPNFAKLGSLRVNRVKAFRKELDDLKIRPGPTYTFGFWGISRCLDVIKWQVVGIPFATPINGNKLLGSPPLRVTIYTLEDGEEVRDETRHLQSRKRIYFNIACWSSLYRPSEEKLRRLVPSSGNITSKEQRRRGSAASWLVCCAQSRSNEC